MNIITTSEELDNYIFRRLAASSDASLADEDAIIGVSEVDEDNAPIVFTLRELNELLDKHVDRILTDGFGMDSERQIAVDEHGEPDVVANLLLELEARNGLPLYNIQNLVCTSMVNLTGTYLLIYS
jgi:hypothetical protein